MTRRDWITLGALWGGSLLYPAALIINMINRGGLS